MSEIEHPPIDMDLQRDVSAERLLAEEVYEMLIEYAHPESVVCGTYRLVYPVTDRCDMDSTDNTKLGLRLRGVPSFSMETPMSTSFTPNAQYYVVEVQQGIPEAGIETPTDHDFTWAPYLVVVINTADEMLKDVHMLNARTGEDLEPVDVGMAHIILRKMHDEYRAAEYKESVRDTPARPTYTDISQRYGSFCIEEADFDDRECGECGVVNAPCKHNAAFLN
ncbi:MAG TPA: hypothetical protein VHD60_03210 [Candidatus Saccharimonadales bacterium]|nr:hypothetical protein [Candidatus Saccharimonadales bacterium]